MNMNETNRHCSKEPSFVSTTSSRNIPLCPVKSVAADVCAKVFSSAAAPLGACAKAFSRAVFHSNKSSEVSACAERKNVEIILNISKNQAFRPNFFFLLIGNKDNHVFSWNFNGN